MYKWRINKLFRQKISYKLLCLSFLCFSNFFILSSSYAVDREQHKAMYLGRLSNYVTWPKFSVENETDFFNICILGEDTFKGFLQPLYNQKSIKEKPVKIHYFDDINAISDCQLLFISLSERKMVTEILEFIKDKPILTISETRGFAGKNGIIQFYMQAQKVRLKINNQAALNQGLKISAKLLAIAKVVDR